jgi:hypothetical protein
MMAAILAVMIMCCLMPAFVAACAARRQATQSRGGGGKGGAGLYLVWVKVVIVLSLSLQCQSLPAGSAESSANAGPSRPALGSRAKKGFHSVMVSFQ